MSGKSETQPPGYGTVQFALKVQEASLEVTARLPEGPVPAAVLLPILQNLSDSLCELAIHSASKMGAHLSCREGCAACCRHAVPIAPVEARAIAEWLGRQPEQRQSVLRERFRQAAARLEESGLAKEIRENAGPTGRGAMHALGLKYFALGVACPFLEEERCAIHETRPLRCREYLVVSPAEHCSHPTAKEIVSIKPPAPLSRILAEWDTNGDPQRHEVILLAMLDEWIARHPANEDRPHRTSPELLQDFLRAFAEDAATTPDDPRMQEPLERCD
jgi:Fe-S-cluster containining protein